MGCRMLSTARGYIPAERTGFTQQPELKAMYKLQLWHSKSEPDTECRSKAVGLFFPATATGKGFTPPLPLAPIPCSSASAQLWEHEWCRCCCRSFTIHEGTTSATNTPSLYCCCKVRIFYFTWPVSLFALWAFHFLGRAGMSFVSPEEERRPNGFKVMTVRQKIYINRSVNVSNSFSPWPLQCLHTQMHLEDPPVKKK